MGQYVNETSKQEVCEQLFFIPSLSSSVIVIVADVAVIRVTGLGGSSAEIEKVRDSSFTSTTLSSMMSIVPHAKELLFIAVCPGINTI